jgi:hypothetical protein
VHRFGKVACVEWVAVVSDLMTQLEKSKYLKDVVFCKGSESCLL